MKLKKLYQELKQRNLTPLFVFLLLFPYIVGFTSDSTSLYTEALVGIGGGQYVYHDCSGAHTKGFADVGIYYGKKYESPFRLGISAGGLAAGERSDAFIYPDLALDWQNFSLGTTGVRIGSQQKFYLEAKWADQPPFFSGKGFVRFGIGGKLNDSETRIWIGANAFPYNTIGLATQIEFPLKENHYLFFNGRYGKEKISNFDEYGFSVGMRIVSY